jgi:hypothetical protein
VLEQKQPATRVVADFDVSEHSVRKWAGERAAAGADEQSEALRRQRLTSYVIARRLGPPLSTAGGVLRRLGRGRRKSLDPPALVVRYQRQCPGELVHLDTNELGRIAGIGHRITGCRSGRVSRHRGIG